MSSVASPPTSIEDMIEALAGAAEQLRRMQADGVTLDPDGGTADDYARLVTTDPAVAKKYDMHDKSEFFDDDGSEEENPLEEEIGAHRTVAARLRPRGPLAR